MIPSIALSNQTLIILWLIQEWAIYTSPFALAFVCIVIGLDL
jgi:hypothetical protein